MAVLMSWEWDRVAKTHRRRMACVKTATPIIFYVHPSHRWQLGTTRHSTVLFPASAPLKKTFFFFPSQHSSSTSDLLTRLLLSERLDVEVENYSELYNPQWQHIYYLVSHCSGEWLFRWEIKFSGRPVATWFKANAEVEEVTYSVKVLITL